MRSLIVVGLFSVIAVGFVAPLQSQVDRAAPAGSTFCTTGDSLIAVTDAVADLDSLARAIRAMHPSVDWARPSGHFEHGVPTIVRDAETGPQCQASMTYLASRMLALLADGHSRVTNAALAASFGALAHRLVWRGDQLIIRVIPETDATYLGREVVAINDMPVTEVMDRLRMVVPHNDNFEFLRYSERYFNQARLINGLTGAPLDGTVTLTVDLDGTRANVTSVLADPSLPRPAVLERDLRVNPIAEQDAGQYVRWAVVDDLFLLRINAVGNQNELSFSARIAEAFSAFDSSGIERIVVDLRGNGGGNGALGPFVTSSIRARPKLRSPGTVYVATDKYTYSAAVMLRDDLVYRGDAISIGEPAGGWPFHPGDNVDFILPASGVAVDISSVYHTVSFAVGNQHPEITLPYALDAEAYRRGSDPLLEAVVTGPLLAPDIVRGLDSMTGRYQLSPAHTLELTSTGDGMRGKIFPVLDSWLVTTDERGVYRLATGLEIQDHEDGIAVRLPGERWQVLPSADALSAWERIAAGDADGGQQALIAAAQSGAPGMDDPSLSFNASQLYAELLAHGTPRPDALPAVRAILLAAQAVNDASPFSDFSLRIYQ